eukprot:m.149820 g.149820  ORF g.149820 m.149820 type:complete len:154 (+) comp16163_c5_seq1:327-788(+)
MRAQDTNDHEAEVALVQQRQDNMLFHRQNYHKQTSRIDDQTQCQFQQVGGAHAQKTLQFFFIYFFGKLTYQERHEAWKQTVNPSLCFVVGLDGNVAKLAEIESLGVAAAQRWNTLGKMGTDQSIFWRVVWHIQDKLWAGFHKEREAGASIARH